MCRRAVILAGGKGTRLKPYTITIPKPLVPIGDKPVLELIIEQLIQFGFTHITITVNYLADLIRAYFGDGSKWNINIDYSLERKALSTMGPLKLITDLPENFLIMNGDILTDLDYSELFNFHLATNSIFTVSTFQRIDRSEYGVIQIDPSTSEVIAFDEKPELKNLVSMGIYVANREILNFIPIDKPYGFDSLMFDLLKSEYRALVKKHSGYWLDIGRPEDYEKAINNYQLNITNHVSNPII